MGVRSEQFKEMFPVGSERRPITVERCCCGYKSCRDYWLVGIGKFVQGSGFTQEEAERIAGLLNGG